jgi:hypothetical protein
MALDRAVARPFARLTGRRASGNTRVDHSQDIAPTIWLAAPLVSPAAASISLLVQYTASNRGAAADPGAWRWSSARQVTPEVPVMGAVATDRPGPRSMTAAPASTRGGLRRTAELLGALSTGLDAAERRTEGHAVRTAYLACRLAEELSLPDASRADLLYAGLLLDAGSTGLVPADHEGKESASSRSRKSRGERALPCATCLDPIARRPWSARWAWPAGSRTQSCPPTNAGMAAVR